MNYSAATSCLEARLARGLLVGLLVLLPALLWTGATNAFEYPKLWLLHLGALALAALGLSRLLAEMVVPRGWSPLRQGWMTLRSDLLTSGVLLFVLSATLSTVASISPLTSLRGQEQSPGGLGTVLAYAVVFLAARWTCRGVDDVRRLLGAAVLGAALAGSYGLLQVLGLDPLTWEQVSTVGSFLRPLGTLGHPNFLGALLIMALPLAWYFALKATGGHHWGGAAAWAGIGLVQGTVVVLTLSRGAWMGLLAAAALVGLVLAWGVDRRLFLRWGSLVGAGLVLLLLVGWWLFPSGFRGPLEERLRSLFWSPSRGHIWWSALQIFTTYPVLGSGLDTFELAYFPHRELEPWREEWGITPTKAHNEVLQILATQGLCGLAALVVLVGGLAQAARRAWQLVAQEDRALVLAIAAALLAFFVQNLFSFTVAGLGLMFAVLAGMLGALGGRVASGPEMSSHPQPQSLAKKGESLVAGRWVLATFILSVRVWFLVLRPLRANLACAQGLALLPSDPARALEQHRQAVTLDPQSMMYWSELAGAAQTIALRSRDAETRAQFFRQARTAFDRAHGLEPRNPHPLINLGTTLSHLAPQGMACQEEVFAAFDQALARDPRNVLFHLEASKAALRLGAIARVEYHARTAAELWPEFGPALGHLGYVELVRGNLRKAAILLGSASASKWYGDEEGHTSALANLALVYFQLGENRNAIWAARETLKRVPQLQAVRQLLERALERDQFFQVDTTPPTE